MLMHKFWFGLLGVLLLAGCTSIDSSKIEPTLKLVFPEGSLPSGVSEADISIELIGFDEVPDEYQWLGGTNAFKLLHEGLQLSEPASFIITLPSKDGVIPRIYHIDENQAVELENLTIIFDPINETVTVIGQISHFSLFINDLEWTKGVLRNEELGEEYLTACEETMATMETICRN